MINERPPASGAVLLVLAAACALAACAPAVLPASASDPAAPGPFLVGFITTASIHQHVATEDMFAVAQAAQDWIGKALTE
jgi:hypothetical protein